MMEFSLTNYESSVVVIEGCLKCVDHCGGCGCGGGDSGHVWSLLDVVK